MKTLHITPEEMKPRIARFSDLKRNPGYVDDPSIPIEAYRAVIPDFYVVLGAETHYGTGDGKPVILGEKGTGMAVIECRPGYKGPLHVHLRSAETFMCLKGRFRIGWNDDGQDHTFLDVFDTIVIPPGLYREFTNVTEEVAFLLVLCTGETDDDALVVCARESKGLAERYGEDMVKRLAAHTGFRFATITTE